MIEETFIPKPCSFEELEIMAKRLRLTAMVKHIAELSVNEQTYGWSIAQWLSVAFQTEIERRNAIALSRHMKEAEIVFEDACYNRLDWTPERRHDGVKINNIFSLEWISRKQHCIITGPTGCGKSWVASAIAVEACLKGFKVKCFRMHTLLRQFARFQTAVSTENDLQIKFLQDLSKLDLIVVDDWLTGASAQLLQPIHRAGLYEIINHGHLKLSFLIVGVPPVSSWSALIGEPVSADSILDRLVGRALRLELRGESMRSKEVYGGIPQESNAAKGGS